MENPIAILLDLDGTLFDTREAWQKTMSTTANYLGLPPTSREFLEVGWGQSVSEDARRFFRGISEEKLSSLYSRFFLNHVGLVRMEPYVDELFDLCQNRNIRTAVVTNSGHEIASTLLKRFLRWTPILVTPTSSVRPKPTPDLLLQACKKLHVKAWQSWMIGDTSFDFRAAEAAKIRFFGYRIDFGFRIESIEHFMSLLEIEPNYR
jgi:HAD superfamily hydrolase (TIGR01549 family)